jgi:hypothetical protein
MLRESSNCHLKYLNPARIVLGLKFEYRKWVRTLINPARCVNNAFSWTCIALELFLCGQDNGCHQNFSYRNT